jgi:uncharacterized protein DUF5666
MVRLLAVAVLSSVAFAQSSSADSKPGKNQAAQPASMLESLLGAQTGLPPLPKGKSTVVGGTIHWVDYVRDQFTLDVFGGGTLKVLFDPRTQVYRDGLKGELRGLHAGDRASVETVLDETAVFARSIRLFSGSPEGECQGQVMEYNRYDHDLTVRDSLSLQPVRLTVPVGTTVVRQGQAASSPLSSTDIGSLGLATGTLVSVKFKPDNKGHGVASHIAILAIPGTAFVFAGNVSFLDLHSGLVVLVDTRDHKRYEVFFDPDRIPMSHEIHEGADVTLTAVFDGSRFVARAITINTPSGNR